ncbi:hypothetical protein DICPUDRAFT_55529 [Dictyostelium purpureum]|uniref:SET domain-containing protein n=1 Tax=Dictyostelium purpureum TaxID=5786 RepID=F0ZMH8_DICPU|nr:uncharacterized protein DICPUDRAFT_55529 [Dictyostelium purpureum]EGC34871.1 hypothetical protein DICPUDRAFT_55529 [Dictyostelium purpureum]|eukprot:XP_003288625.1 hypothetical protein DICPUDRAFT_55529 [Dictyostelium purpureum]
MWYDNDVSKGLYTYPLKAVNEVDTQPLTETLTNFKWIDKSFCDHKPIHNQEDIEGFLFGCDCKGDCFSNRDTCICIRESGITYDSNGGIDTVSDSILECNNLCKCSHEKCKNRIIQRSQNNYSYPLELFKTPNKGWSVRAVIEIPKNSFVCEYVGEIITHKEADRRGSKYDSNGLSYLYDLDYKGKEDCEVIDATFYGNVARFINHSCDPNLKKFFFFFDQRIEGSRARISFFSSKVIREGEELTFDYCYELPIGIEHLNEIEGAIPCHCGSKKCRKWLWVPNIS